MIMDEAVDVARVVRFPQRHMTVCAALGLRRVVERARAQARDAARLPVVVIVEPAHPPVVVHRNVQMHLVANRTELGRLCAHKRLEESPAVRFRIFFDHEIDEPPQIRILRRHQLAQRGILQNVVAVSHRALDHAKRVADHAADPRLRGRRVDARRDRRVEISRKEERRVMAPRAPLRWPYADGVLHVDDCLPVPLVVERREVVHRAFPLAVDIRVAAFARLRVHEKILRHRLSRKGLSRTRKELARRAGALLVHARRRDLRIANHVSSLPGNRPHPPGPRGDSSRYRQTKRQPQRRFRGTLRQPSPPPATTNARIAHARMLTRICESTRDHS